jgi:hypothetical protein
MPFLVLIAPLLTLYMKFKLVQFAVKLSLFGIIYLSFKQTMQWVINTVLGTLDAVQLPCMVSYVMNKLDMFSMINFALSFYATVYLGKFFYNQLTRLI